MSGWLDKFQNGGKIKDERLEAIERPDNTYVKPTFTETNIKKPIRTEKEQRAKFNKLPKEQQQRILYNQYAEQHGDIKPAENQSIGSKTWEVLTHPMTAAGYAARNENLPDNFSRGERNSLDTAIDIINPAFYLNQANEAVNNVGNSVNNIAQDNLPAAYRDIKNAGMNVVNTLPIASEYKALGNLANKAGKVLTTEEGLLSNAHKINPWAFKSNPEAYYRGIGKSGYDDAIKSGVLRQSGYETGVPKHKEVWYGTGNKGFSRAKGFANDYIAEVPKSAFPNASLDKFAGSPGMQTRGTLEHIPIENAKILKKDWLQGYKEVPKPTSNFNSEIDWGKWNKEISDNPQLIKEYNAIEQSSKANGSWMKNPDGSIFQGTPEQFVQQNSENFKKAFPNGFEQTYRGTQGESPMLKPNRVMFTGSEDLARGYTSFDNPLEFLNSEEAVKRGGTHNLAYPKSENSLIHDTRNSDWQHVNLSSVEDTQKNIDKNIERISQDIERKKNMAKTAKQHTEGYWEFPNSDIKISDKVFKEGTAREEQELQKLIDIKNNGFISTNSKLLSDIKTKLGNQPITDDIAKYIEDYNIDNITLKNIEDGSFGDISMINHKPGNYLKSLWGNNGMFDMTNPNIYKAILPIGLGLGAASQLDQKKDGGIIKDNRGQWDHPGEITEIGSPNITMRDVNYPVLGVSKQTGEKKLMHPEKNYKFANTKQVTEYPLMNWLDQYT